METVDGIDVPTWVPAVYPVHPSYDNFTTEAMLQAGVDPSSIHISTQVGDRVDSIEGISQFSAEADSILSPDSEPTA